MIRVSNSVRALLALGATLVLACTDSATAPTTTKKAPSGVAASRGIDLSNRPDIFVTVTTVATYRDKAGKIHEVKYAPQRVRASFRRGLARPVAASAATASTGKLDAT